MKASPFFAGDVLANQEVGLLLLVGLSPTGGRGIDGNKGDRRLGKRRLHFCDERLVVGEDLLRTLAGSQIVGAGVKNNDARSILDHDAVGKHRAVRDLRAAEPAIDHAE